LDSLQATPLPGTVGAYSAFFSPDGGAIAFWTGRPRATLKTLDLATGQSKTVVEIERGVEFPIGGTWATNGRIYYGAGFAGVFAVPATGGSPIIIAAAKPGDSFHGWPQMLPDGAHLVFTAWQGDDLAHAKTDILNLKTGERRTILQGAVGAQYLATGHVAYIRESTLFAQRFDVRTLQPGAPPVRVLDRVGSVDAQPLYAVSAKGTLVYHPGSLLTELTEMFWVSEGKEEKLAAPAGYYTDPALSPDDARVAIAPSYDGHQEIWVHEFGRGTWTRVTHSPVANAPVWNPVDRDAIVFTSVGRAGSDLFSTRADGSGPVELLYASAYPKFATSAAPAAGLVSFTEVRPDTQADVWLLDVKTRRARPVLQTAEWECAAALSPDGRWLAYESGESFHPMVYVRPLSGAPAKWVISTGFGRKPRWSRDGRSIVYITPKGLMRVAVHAGESFSADKPELVSDTAFVRHGMQPNWELALDGRLLVMKQAKEQPRHSLVVVQNWFAEFERSVAQSSSASRE
jgi:serine/threonine-protein kinase